MHRLATIHVHNARDDRQTQHCSMCGTVIYGRLKSRRYWFTDRGCRPVGLG